MRWGKHRHVRKTVDWIVNKYFHTIGNSKWNFSAFKDGKPVAVLLKHSATRFRRYVKVKGRSSPYDGNLVYWSTRMGRHPELTSRIARFLKQQKVGSVPTADYISRMQMCGISTPYRSEGVRR